MYRALRLPGLVCALVLLGASASPVLAFDGCYAADVSGDGQVDFLDLGKINDVTIPIARRDLDGSGLIDDPDVLMAFGFIFRTCTGCTADLDGSGVVDAADRALLEAAYDTDCRLDMDRNGTVDADNDVDIWVYYFQHSPTPASARPPSTAASLAAAPARTGRGGSPGRRRADGRRAPGHARHAPPSRGYS